MSPFIRIVMAEVRDWAREASPSTPRPREYLDLTAGDEVVTLPLD